MRKIQFKIHGNHKSATGNPVPKLKMTGNQHWTPRAKEYVQWKEHVVYALLAAVKEERDLQRLYASEVARHGKPFVLGATQHALMILRISWSNKAHGDPENIFGSIADALFKNDKSLDCCTLSTMATDKLNGKPRGGVDVRVYIFDSELEKLDFMSRIII